MNIAILIAGGSGLRMGLNIPKQFLKVYDKPVIVYTMEAFQKHPEIDKIIVVCKEGWQKELKSYAKEFNITKLSCIVSGGKVRQDSVKNGLLKAKELFSNDDIVLIHDGNRPLVSQEIISENIEKCICYGNAITAIPCIEAMAITENNIDSTSHVNRDKLRRTQTPQAFKLGDVFSAYEEAEKKGITNTLSSCTLYIEIGRKIYFSAGSEKNIKLTTPEDIDIFKALLKSK